MWPLSTEGIQRFVSGLEPKQVCWAKGKFETVGDQRETKCTMTLLVTDREDLDEDTATIFNYDKYGEAEVGPYKRYATVGYSTHEACLTHVSIQE